MTVNIKLNSTRALKLPKANQVRELADHVIAEQFTDAVAWIDEHVTPAVLGDPSSYRCSVPLVNCGGALRAAVLYTLDNSGYAAKVEDGPFVNFPRLNITWSV